MIKSKFVVCAPVAIALALGACGSDDKKKDDPTPTNPSDVKVGAGYVARATGGKVSVDLTGTDAGAQYVLMPYVLGDLTKIKGSTADKFTFTVASGAGAGTGSGSKAVELMQPVLMRGTRLSTLQIDHMRRTLLNRFDPRKGENQGEEFWATARALDQNEGMALLSGETPAAKAADSVEEYYRGTAKNSGRTHHSVAHASMPLTAGTCPTDKILIPSEADVNTADAPLALKDSEDGGDFCLAYADTPVTESDKAKIKATVSTVLAAYKKTIYKDEFTGGSGYTFKPIIAIVDFSDENHWPKTAALQVAGVFLGAMSQQAKQPMLYMAADFSKLATPIKSDSDPNLANKLFHSTIAHEMQHAVMNYYRSYSVATGVEEEQAIDEGIAHLMEDAWGYGLENFNGFPKNFLSTFVYGADPFVCDTQDCFDKDHTASSRGSAQAMLFYLASQAKGFTFKDGKLSGGEGLDFITKIVKNTSASGAQNVAAQFGGDADAWTDTMGNFLGALMLDGSSSVADVDDKYKTGGPQKVVTDLNGNAGKSFGMKFSNYAGDADRVTEVLASDDNKIEKNATVELTYYKTKPLVYTSAGGGTSFTFSLPADTAGTAVSVIRIK